MLLHDKWSEMSCDYVWYVHVCCHQCVRRTILLLVFFFKQKTAYELRISDWSSDVCSSDLRPISFAVGPFTALPPTMGETAITGASISSKALRMGATDHMGSMLRYGLEGVIRTVSAPNIASMTTGAGSASTTPRKSMRPTRGPHCRSTN